MLCSVPSKCKTRRELGCEPVRKVMHFQERGPSQRTTTQPLPLEGASRPSIRKIQAAQEPLFVRPFVVIANFIDFFFFFNYPCIPSPSATPAPPTPRLSLSLFLC